MEKFLVENWRGKPVPSNFPPLDRGEHPRGSYIEQSETHKATPSGRPVEVDHMTPDSLHQPIGQKRSSTEGGRLSKRLPATAMDKLQHRRKLTTGSGEVVEHHREYLRAAHLGLVPFAGPMETTQDHYAAALQIEFRSTWTPSTLFGEATLHDPRVFHGASQLGDVPQQDALWSIALQDHLLDRVETTSHITPAHTARLDDVLTEQRQAVVDMYKNRGKP